MDDALNPVEQLAAILRKLQNPSGQSLGTAIARAMGRTGDQVSQRDQLSDFGVFVGIASDALQYTEEHAPARAKERHVKYVETILNHILNLSPNSSAGTFQPHNFSNEHIERIEALGESLADHGTQRRATEEELASLVTVLNELVELIQESNIDARLKSRMLVTLGILRTEVSRINIIGPEEAVKTMDRLMGEAFRAALSSQGEKEKADALAVLQRVAGAAEHLEKVYYFGKKAWPVLLAGGKALGLLP